MKTQPHTTTRQKMVKRVELLAGAACSLEAYAEEVRSRRGLETTITSLKRDAQALKGLINELVRECQEGV